MLDLFIIFDRHPLLAELATDYASLEAAVEKVNAALTDLKNKRGQRVHQDHVMHPERERAYEVSFIKLELESGCMFAAIRKLYATRDKVNAARANEFKDWYLTSAALIKNNIMCATELCDEASKLYFAVERQGYDLDRMASYCFAIDRLFANPPACEDPREFVVMSSGHGSAFRFDGGDGKEVPPPPYMTLDEAKAAAEHWELISDTIGGHAQIYNVRTGSTNYSF